MRSISLSIVGIFYISTLLAAPWEYPGEVTTIGAEETVFEWTADSCEWDNIPDAPPRVFRDADGVINMTVGHYVTYRLTGPDFDNLSLDCSAPIHTSDFDSSDPSLHNDREWLSALYTEDGITVHALVHNEYHGFSDTDCPDPADCGYTSLTYAVSTDSGRTYTHATAPDHLIVAVDEATVGQRYGVIEPTNIIKYNGYYYFIAEAWGSNVERYPYIFRTDNIADPTSWEGWDGVDFNVDLGNPYTDAVDYSAMMPLGKYTPWEGNIAYMHGSLTYNTYFGKFMLIGTTVKGHQWGIYYSLSDDLIHWTQRILVKSFTGESTGQGDPAADPSRNHIYYATVIDHGDVSRNFEYTDDSVYLYYVRTISQNSAGSNYPYQRELVRQEIQFSKRIVDGFTVTRRGDYEDIYQGDGLCETSAGNCSFRAALLESRYRPPYYADSLLTINFAIEVSDHTITPAVGPYLGPTFPVAIDASTQDTYVANSNGFTDGMNTQWGVEITGDDGYLILEGDGSSVNGLKFPALTISSHRASITACDIGSISINSTDNNILGGITDADRNRIGNITVNGPADSIIIQNNYIGTDADGTTSAGRSESAVNVRTGATNTVIRGNLLSGSGFAGVEISDSTTMFTEITDNYIGVDRTGTAVLANIASGIKINQSAQNTTVSGNIIGGNAGEAGIYLEGISGTTIQNNYIGTNAAGDDLGNSGDGIWISGQSYDNFIGGENPGDGNSIAHNDGLGVSLLVMTGSGNRIWGNSIHSNGGEGIGNFTHISVAVPELTSAIINDTGDSVLVTSTLTDSANADYYLEFFANTECDPGGAGEGQTFLGSAVVTTDSNGFALFSANLPGTVNSGEFITATLTDPENNTSAFSTCREAFPLAEAPEIATSIDTMSFDFAYNETPIETQNLTVFNNGMHDLEWRYSTAADWLWLEPSDGTVASGDSAIVGITVDGRGLEAGIYSAEVSLLSNAGNVPDYDVVVRLTIQADPGSPDLSISPDTLRVAYPPSDFAVDHTESIDFTNNGSDGLSWNANSNQPWLYGLSPNNGTLNNGETQTMSFNIQVSQNLNLGTHTAFIVINGWYGSDSPVPHEVVVEVTISDENLPPVAQDVAVDTEPGVPVEIDLPASDPNQDPLTLSILTQPEFGVLEGSPPLVTYLPDSGFVGVDSFLFVADDGALTDTGQVTITVLPESGVQFEGLSVFTDASGPEMCGTGAYAYLYMVESGCGETTLGTLSAERTDFLNDLENVTVTMGNFTMVVDSFYCIDTPWGDHRVYSGGTVRIERNGEVILALQNITMTSDQDYNQGTMSGTATGELDLTQGDPDFQAEFNPEGDGLVDILFTGSNQVVQGSCGLYDFSMVIAPHITPVVNQPPMAEDQSVTTTINSPIDIELTASDPDEDVLSWSIIQLPFHGSLPGDPPLLTYTPDEGFFGLDSFFFAVSDGELADTGRVLIEVAQVNAPPIANALMIGMEEDQTAEIQFSADDPDGDSLSFALVSDPLYGILNGNSSVWQYTPDPDFFGHDSFAFSVSDGLAADTAMVSITVHPVNDAPGDFALLTPADDHTLTITPETLGDTLFFRWSSSVDVDDDAIEYSLEFSESITFLGDWIEMSAATDTTAWLVYQLPMIAVDSIATGTWSVTAADTSLVTEAGNGPFALTVDMTELGTEPGMTSPYQYALHPAYPNPFNPATTIDFDLPEAQFVTITVYNMLGQKVTELVNKKLDAGRFSLRWEAQDNHGQPVSAGVYLVRLKAGDFQQVRKVVLLK